MAKKVKSIKIKLGNSKKKGKNKAIKSALKGVGITKTTKKIRKIPSKKCGVLSWVKSWFPSNKK